MKENFTISISNSSHFFLPTLFKYIICLVISLVIIYPILGLSSMESIVSVVILFLILFVILNSMTNENLPNELPQTLYPYTPNLGLDGISKNVYVAGLTSNQQIA
jgi:hypothetical protein